MRRIAALLIAAGAAVWLTGMAAWVLGVWVTLPPAAVEALALSLAALGGGALVAAGAALGRAARREQAAGATAGRRGDTGRASK